MDGYYEIREITNTWLGLDPNDDRFKAIWTEARDGQRFIATENDDLNYGHWFFFFFFFFFWSVAVGSDKPRYMRTDDFETLIARDRKGWDVKEVVF